MKPAVKPLYYILLLTGAVLRLIPYCLNRSLWLDEAAVALNITNRSFAGLLHSLDYNQVAPVLFLFTEKINILLFGNSELSLRLLPLLCGLLSLPLVYHLTKSLSGNSVASLIALFLFATSSILISYSNEVKQYEGDVFSSLCLLNLVFTPSLNNNDTKRYLLLAVTGMVLLFMSNIIELVLFTIGVYYLFKYRFTIFKKPWLLVMFMCWAIAFLVYYGFFIYHNANHDQLVGWWQNNFMPLNIFSANFWEWMYNTFQSVFKFYSLPFLAVYLLSAIIFVIQKQRLYLYFLVFPLAVHFIISGFKLYPFDTRLTLYLTAFITPAMAIGVVELIPVFKKRLTGYITALLLLLLVYSLIAQLVNTHYPFKKEEIKESIDFINANKTPGQTIYVYFAADYAMYYYIKVNRISANENFVWGKGDYTTGNGKNCFNEITKLKGVVWLLFSDNYPSEEEYIINHLTETGTPILKSFKATGSSAYLISINKQ